MNVQTPQFLRAVERTVKIEGGFVDNPLDRGGPTNLGITLPTLDRWYRQELNRPATLEDLKSLNHEGARQLYCDLYWNDGRLPCQDIADWWEPLSWECFDSAVLHGPRQSGFFLQRALNLLNKQGTVVADLKVDGWAGRSTLTAMQAVGRLPRGQEALLLAVNIEQAAFLRNLAMEDPTQEEFYRGWILQRVELQGVS